MRQLILDLIPEHPPTLENFAAGSNADALTALAGWLSADNREVSLFLWGDSGAGKSHLLRAIITDSAGEWVSNSAGESAGAYVDCAADPLLAGLPAEAMLIAADNVEALAGDGQIALFNHFNRLRAAGGRLLAAAAVPPQQLALREDLRTRLGSGLIFRLRPLSDAEKVQALTAQACERGMSLTPEALDYLLARAPRDMRSLSAYLAALDRYSLEHKRPLTLPLLREVLQSASLAPPNS